MKKSLLSVLLLSIFVSAPVLADKPSWTGKGKATEEQKESHKAAMKAKRGPEDEKMEKFKETKMEEKKETERTREMNEKAFKKESAPTDGLEKQQIMKQEQIQKEVDKGSEQGQESREPRKKWWKFWEK